MVYRKRKKIKLYRCKGVETDDPSKSKELILTRKKVILPKDYETSYWEIQKKREGHQASLITYVIENSQEIDPKRQRPAVLICPGGGYGMKSEREAESVALAMNARGFQAFILDYSV